MIAIDIGAMVQTALEDRARCRLAGVAEIDPNSEAATYVVGLANRLRDRIGPRAAMRAAFMLWNELEVGAGETLQ